jgi:hypothetical protein
MNRNSADSYIPAEILFSPAEPPLWGRLLSLSPEGAVLLSRFELRGIKAVKLAFGLGRASFTGLRAGITAAARDADGWYEYSLSFRDPGGREQLRAAMGGCVPGSVEAARE